MPNSSDNSEGSASYEDANSIIKAETLSDVLSNTESLVVLDSTTDLPNTQHGASSEKRELVSPPTLRPTTLSVATIVSTSSANNEFGQLLLSSKYTDAVENWKKTNPKEAGDIDNDYCQDDQLRGYSSTEFWQRDQSAWATMSTFDILLEVLGVKGNGNPWVVEAPFPPKSMLYNPNWYDDWKDLPLGTNIRGFVKAFKLTYMSKDWDAKTCLNWWNSLCEIIVRCSELRTHPALLLLVLIYLLPKPFSVDLRSSVVNAMIAVNSCTLAKDAADKCVLLVWLLHVGKYRQSIKEADEEEKDTWVTHRRMFISAVTSLLNKFMADVSASLALPKEKTIADRIGFYQSLKLTTVINDVTSFQDIFTLEDKLFQELNSSEVINVSVLSMKERFLKLRYILSWPLKRLTDNKKCSTLVPLLNDVKLVSSLLENSKVISEKDFDDFKEKTVALDRYVKSIWPSFFSELKAQSSVPGPVTTSTTMPSLKDKSSSVNASKNENIPDSSVGKNTKEDSSATRAIGDKPATPGKASTSTGIPPGTYCFKCGSKDHWANHCPVRNATEARSSTPSSSSSSSSSTPSPGKGKSTGKSGKGKGKKGSGNYQTKFGRSIRQPDFFTGGTVSTPMAGGNLVSEVPLRMELSQKAFKPYRCIWDSGSEISLIDSDICPYFWRINPIDISGIKPFETDKAAEFIVGFKDSDSPGMIARALLCPPGSLPGDAKVLLGRDFLAESGINLRFHGAANSDNSSKVLDSNTKLDRAESSNFPQGSGASRPASGLSQ